MWRSYGVRGGLFINISPNGWGIVLLGVIWLFYSFNRLNYEALVMVASELLSHVRYPADER
jgi:hypothetical protein